MADRHGPQEQNRTAFWCRLVQVSGTKYYLHLRKETEFGHQNTLRLYVLTRFGHQNTIYEILPNLFKNGFQPSRNTTRGRARTYQNNNRI
jgi:hypothetical protein